MRKGNQHVRNGPIPRSCATRMHAVVSRSSAGIFFTPEQEVKGEAPKLVAFSEIRLVHYIFCFKTRFRGDRGGEYLCKFASGRSLVATSITVVSSCGLCRIRSW